MSGKPPPYPIVPEENMAKELPSLSHRSSREYNGYDYLVTLFARHASLIKNKNYSSIFAIIKAYFAKFQRTHH